MAVGTKLQMTIKEWGILVMFIVVISVILLNFSTNGSVVCPSATPVYVEAESLCCLTAATCASGNASALGTQSTITTFVSAFAEPQNWVSIVIIALIGIALLALFSKLKNR